MRLIVRRVKPTPGSQLALFANYSYHAFITDRDGDTLALEADHRRHAELENAIRDLKYGVGLNHLPSGRFAANGAWLAVQVIAHNLARWTTRVGLGEQLATTKTLRRRFFSMAGRLTSSARRLTLHLPQGLALAEPVQQRSGETARPPTPFLTAPDPSARLPTGLAVPRQAGTSVSTAAICPADLPLRNHLRSSTTAVRGAHSPHPAESLRIKALQLFPEPLIPALASATASLRWIRANAYRNRNPNRLCVHRATTAAPPPPRSRSCSEIAPIPLRGAR